MKALKLFSLSLVVALAHALPATTVAQEYPSARVRMVVPYPPGSSPDALARIVADGLSAQINQTVIVDNKSGASGMIGAREVSNSTPNGADLLIYTPAWPAAKIFMKEPPVPIPDGLAPVRLIGEGRFALTVPGELPVNTFEEFVEYAKQHPGELNFANTGFGDAYLYYHELSRAAGIELESIQFKGSSEYLPALISNHVQAALAPEYTVLPFVKEGRLKVLAVSGDVRSPAYPDTPSFAELGYPQIRTLWIGVLASPKTSPELLDRISEDIAAVIRTPDADAKIRQIFFDPTNIDRHGFAERIAAEIRDWQKLAASVGIKPQ